MTDRHNCAYDAEIDTEVSNAYRASANETVPAHLDRLVLREARRSATGRSSGLRLSAWLVPAAVATVAAFSLSINFEFNRPDATPAGRYPAVGQSRDNDATPPGSAENLETAVEATGIRLRALDEAVSNLAPANNPDSAATGDTSRTISPAADAGIDDSACGAAETASAESWWACIQALQRIGRTDAAKAELERFQAAFPESGLAR